MSPRLAIGAAVIAVALVAGADRELRAQSLQAASEPPAEIAAAHGTWRLWRESGAIRLDYDAHAFPELSIPLLSITCRWPNRAIIELAGFVPQQQFPQPVASLQMGGVSFSGMPDAAYVARVDNPPGGVPSHPAYATLTFETKLTTAFLESLEAGRSLRVSFAQQDREFPVAPPELAHRFATMCASAAPVPPARPI